MGLVCAMAEAVHLAAAVTGEWQKVLQATRWLRATSTNVDKLHACWVMLSIKSTTTWYELWVGILVVVWGVYRSK